jgi:hypothetical protein
VLAQFLYEDPQPEPPVWLVLPPERVPQGLIASFPADIRPFSQDLLLEVAVVLNLPPDGNTATTLVAGAPAGLHLWTDPGAHLDVRTLAIRTFVRIY